LLEFVGACRLPYSSGVLPRKTPRIDAMPHNREEADESEKRRI
jgi:hypothetical protein